jgi:ubiquinone/menaquinone biosynthesis C-methylase UbiE
MYLPPEHLRRVYDRIGRFQDMQLYEHRATRESIAHADFEHARAVFELGYGTGAFAERLLERHLPGNGRYVGLDLSPRMQELATRRLQRFADRVDLRLTSGSLCLPFADASFDRFVANYLLDLLSPNDIGLVLAEAQRLLVRDGLVCLASLTHGATGFARLVGAAWRRAWSTWPALVGGCRPIRLIDYIDTTVWSLRHHAVVTRLGISSELVIAASR